MNCTYCQEPARLVTGRELYPHRADLADTKTWVCSCGARVGCHNGTERPKGTFARPERIRARQFAHRIFDPLWMNYHLAYEGQPRSAKLQRCARDRAYWWLTRAMGREKQVHIGEMTEAECAQVVELIRTLKPTPASIRAEAKQRKGER